MTDMNEKPHFPGMLAILPAVYLMFCAALCLAALGCASPDEPEGSVRASLTGNAPAPEVDSRGVSLPGNPAGAVPLLAEGPVFDASKMTQAILDLDGPGAIVKEVVADGLWRGRVGRKSVDVNTLDGRIVVRDDRAYDNAGSTVDPDAAKLFARAKPLLSALGACEAEMLWKIGGIGREALDVRTGAVGKPERIASKVYIERTVAGLPVAGDRLVVGFALDGTLRKVLGQWRRIDHGIAPVPSALSSDGVVQRGLALVEARRQSRHVILRAGMPIRVSTRWMPVSDPSGGWTLALYGKVSIPGAVEDSYRWSELDFPLGESL